MSVSSMLLLFDANAAMELISPVSDFELCPPPMRSGAREPARAGSLFVQKFSRKNQKIGL